MIVHRVCLLFATFWTSIQIVTGSEWDSSVNTAFYKLFRIPNSVSINEALVSTENSQNTVASCSLFCWESGSVSLYYRHSEKMCFCNNGVDSRLNVDSPTDEPSSDVVYGHVMKSVQVLKNDNNRKFVTKPLKENCFVLYQNDYRKDGLYSVQPIGSSTVVDTFCKMDEVLESGADDCLQWLQFGYESNGVYKVKLSNSTSIEVWCDQQGGGWTVFQRRQDSSVSFYRGWAEYVNGFGNVYGNYWLGLEAIRQLAARQTSSLRIDMGTFGDVTPTSAYAVYTRFALQSAGDKYRLSYGSYSGSCGNGLFLCNGMQFTTFDNDNDPAISVNIALMYSGAWWYNVEQRSNLNGLYKGGVFTDGFANGMSWFYCWTHQYSVKYCTLKVRRT